MTESIGKTLRVVVTVALLCSAMVTLAVYYLRPIQLSAAAEQRMQAVLSVAGRLPLDAEQHRSTYQALDARIFDFERSTIAGAVGIDAHLYDHWDETQAPSLDDPSNDIGLSNLPRYAPVYVIFDGDEVEGLVLPFHGRGMWSTIHGYISLRPDLRTISALHVFRHGETMPDTLFENGSETP